MPAKDSILMPRIERYACYAIGLSVGRPIWPVWDTDTHTPSLPITPRVGVATGEVAEAAGAGIHSALTPAYI